MKTKNKPIEGERSPQTLKLGETGIDGYITLPGVLDEKGKKELDDLIQQMQDNALNVEQLPLKLLKIQKMRYPKIDVSFLSMSNNIEHKGYELPLPRFSVYKKNDEGFERIFSIAYTLGKSNAFSDEVIYAFRQPKYTEVSINGGRCRDFEGTGRLPSRIERNLVESTFPYKWGHEEYGSIGNLDKCYRFPCSFKDFLSKDEKIIFTSEFIGIIPPKTKEKLKKAEEIFENDMYLIAETKPEEWNVSKIKTDPLIIGNLRDEYFFIDHFNTTPIENYVRREFTY